MIEKIQNVIKSIKKNKFLGKAQILKAEEMMIRGCGTFLFISPEVVSILVDDDKEEKEIVINIEEENVYPIYNKEVIDWDVSSLCALLCLEEKLEHIDIDGLSGMQYTREGMIKRVMEERAKKAYKANYRIAFANNIYGEHTLTNEKGVKYKITLRDFENEIGYDDSHDLRANKLGTTKHIMYAFAKLKNSKSKFKKLSKKYPFVEIFLDPLNDYKISWYYPHELPEKVAKLIYKYFGKKKQSLSEGKNKRFLKFIQEAEKISIIKIRQEVYTKVENAYSRDALIALQKKKKISYSKIKAKLFPYQQEGVEFATFKKGAIIADEMGLGKTLQAITIAIQKKRIFGFERTLVICPASLKAQWKNEIEKFTSEKATVVEGFPDDRAEIYKTCTDYFLILNYETILRDAQKLNKFKTDFIILDEAQRIKNYATKTAQALKSLKRDHALIITGTPIENKLIDLYSVVQFVDPYFLAPLWEFSYQHCHFSTKSKDQILGYYNLKALKNRMKSILIRREKRNVIKQLPSVQQITVPIGMHPKQEELHASLAYNIARILSKKYRTPYDMQRLMMFLTNMRMVCNSTYLLDSDTNFSPKLDELKHILLDKLDLHNNKRKIIIFSEWIRTHKIIGDLLRGLNIGYVELSGKIPVKKRGKIIEKFEQEDKCRVFLSTEAGGSGLNLQVADTVINFEIPWNPAKKNQRIGRIDRLGQKNAKLTVINLVTRDSIETKIAAGLILKQNLFEGVLDTDSKTDIVDFSAKGKSQFLRQMEEMIADFDQDIYDVSNAEEIEDISVEEVKDIQDAQEDKSNTGPNTERATSDSKKKPKLEEMEKVMNHGLDFLASLYKMSTGEEMSNQDKSIEIDKKTGEVVMRFKVKV